MQAVETSRDYGISNQSYGSVRGRPSSLSENRSQPQPQGQVSEARVTRSMSLASKYQQSKVLEGNPSPAQSNTVARRGSRGGLANKYSSLNGKPSRTYSTPSSTFYSPQPPQPPTETVVNMIPAVVHSPSEQSIPRYGDIFRSLRETDLKEFFKPQKCVMLEHSPHAGRKRSLSLSPTYCKPLKLPPRTLRPSSGSSGPPPLPSKSRRTLKSSASAGSVNRQPTVQAQVTFRAEFRSTHNLSLSSPTDMRTNTYPPTPMVLSPEVMTSPDLEKDFQSLSPFTYAS